MTFKIIMTSHKKPQLKLKISQKIYLVVKSEKILILRRGWNKLFDGVYGANHAKSLLTVVN